MILIFSFLKTIQIITFIFHLAILYIMVAYSEPCQTSKMEFSQKYLMAERR